jgi:hypothetical protein
MNLHTLSLVHALPLWFLVLTLFFPRVGLLLLWLQASRLPFHLTGLVSLVFAILLPRLLVLYMIYLDLGIGLWFIIHLVAALLVWGGSGNYHSRRYRRRDV